MPTTRQLRVHSQTSRSHQRATSARESGRSAEEIVGVEVTGRWGSTALVDRDEGIRPQTTPSTLADLAPAFSPDGHHHGGQRAQPSDGAAAVVVVSVEAGRGPSGSSPLAEIVSKGMCAEHFAYLHTVPAITLQAARLR